jgi:hypothetical protein
VYICCGLCRCTASHCRYCIYVLLAVEVLPAHLFTAAAIGGLRHSLCNDATCLQLLLYSAVVGQASLAVRAVATNSVVTAVVFLDTVYSARRLAESTHDTPEAQCVVERLLVPLLLLLHKTVHGSSHTADSL